MITNGFHFIAFMLLFIGVMVWLESKYKDSKFFTYVPALIIVYFGTMLFSTFGFWQGEEVLGARGAIKDAILPAMIFLMLLRADLRDIAKLGWKMILSFFSATLTITIGFVVSFTLFKGILSPDAPLTLGALAGSWVGGVQNMSAVMESLNLNSESMGYTLLIDSIDYSMWIMFLLAMVPFAKKFNKWTKADTSVIDKVNENLTIKFDKISTAIEHHHILLLLGLAFSFTALAQTIAGYLPGNFETGWTIIIITFIGLACAMTPLGKIPGAPQLSNVLLYLLIGLIAATSNFAELTQAPAYILTGFVILLVHGVLMLIIAKLFKLDLFTCGVASLANIGGVASAPVLAAAYSQSLVPIAVLMALIGVSTGTFIGILISNLLAFLA
ncbi:DUF819 domain-containing protein [Facklamia sp. 7083-14-GEN3]|uniref:DUF819 family protein n=1 Tax=Facklamia sp. 7083-14-GEN3 TaxID=2973478 RepID=UPI00215BFD7B|nr:DUF819 family protein [Facklamia sp. 7083-14-GEN3]MCR8969458.1 DUF819 family protein [Facklamia sp. 7083-14-GEN3]